MGSPIVGRAPCPLCPNQAAHVKRSEKTLFLYCPECGTQLLPRNDHQRELLKAKTRPVEGSAPPAPEPTPPAPAPKPSTKPAPPPAPTPPTKARNWADI